MITKKRKISSYLWFIMYLLKFQIAADNLSLGTGTIRLILKMIKFGWDCRQFKSLSNAVRWTYLVDTGNLMPVWVHLFCFFLICFCMLPVGETSPPFFFFFTTLLILLSSVHIQACWDYLVSWSNKCNISTSPHISAFNTLNYVLVASLLQKSSTGKCSVDIQQNRTQTTGNCVAWIS